MPKANVKGSVPSIGRTGNTKGETSTAGGQHGHLPSPSSYPGTFGKNVKSGQTTTPTPGATYPFLPSGKKGK